ncbi:methylmalonyl-CoA mutase family protein [Bacillus sp. KH172YL63]|uniref:methylmalonyl-CoA mutase family protein n=1 Tax=Bacillus sp. KH172YL63 TaxID=2709784 RepID=UPI0013E43215|nr:methylmalonyl-CoA mutase family protein [Bacillus sp. KH172YL63]BCB04662.1 methylmalonyl-CoA mutase [Bacillus sp. KH172YL63]
MKLNDMKDQTFSRFTLAEWQDAAEKALKGKGIQSLHTNTYENIELKPLYTKEDVPARNRVKDFIPDAGEKITRTPKWYIAQSIKRSSWRSLQDAVTDALARGQNCLSFSLDQLDSEGLASFMVETVEDHVPAFVIEEHTASAIFNVGTASDLMGMVGVIGFDPISSGHGESGLEDWCKKLDEADKHFPQVRKIIVDSSSYHDKGANATQELAIALSEGVCYIETLCEKGWSLEKVAGNMHFHFSIGSQFFMEIAKIRAFKKLWQEVLASYGLSGERCAQAVSVSAETSSFSKSALDPYVNMLRGGGEAFSAILAGVDYLVVSPFDMVTGEVSPFSERIARNTQLILGEEAHLDKVVDPGGGSYYLEWLTEEVGKCAWKEFQHIDRAGGILASIGNGSLHEKIEKLRESRINDLATRKHSMIGTNIYANLEEEIGSVAPVKGERLSLPFERLRERANKLTGKPVAGLIGLGTLKDHKPRTDFVQGFLAAGGVHAKVGQNGSAKEDVLQFVEETRFPYYVICGKDEEYEHMLPLIIESIHQIDPSIVVDIAGKVPSGKREEWSRTGLSGSIYMGQNILEKLDELLSIWEEGTEYA